MWTENSNNNTSANYICKSGRKGSRWQSYEQLDTLFEHAGLQFIKNVNIMGKKWHDCVAAAAMCGATIVEQFSDYIVEGYEGVALSVHCGLGAGHLVGLHAENEDRTRRRKLRMKLGTNTMVSSFYEKVCSKYDHMNPNLLYKLPHQLALYVHPVACKDEYAKHDDDGYIMKSPNSRINSKLRHLKEAELRSIFVMFIQPQINTKITGVEKEDSMLFRKYILYKLKIDNSSASGDYIAGQKMTIVA